MWGEQLCPCSLWSAMGQGCALCLAESDPALPHPVGAAAIQTLLVLRALSGLHPYGNGAEVMLCLLPVLTCTSLIQVLLVVPLLG